jgi:hypothetical protein
VKNKAESIEKYRQGICLLDRETIERLAEEVARQVVKEIPGEGEIFRIAA